MFKIKGTAFLKRVLAAIVFALILPCAAYAGNATWTGTVGDSLWSTLGNWSLTPVPGSGYTATFNGAGNGQTTIDLTGGVSITNILFDTSAAASYTIGAGAVGSQTLVLGTAGGAVTMNSTVVNDQTFNAALTLGGNATVQTYTFANDSLTNFLIFAGDIAGGTGGTAGVKTLTLTGAGTTRITGAIGNGGATSVALTKSGSGSLVLSGNNSYSGATTISSGTLQILGSGLLGAGNYAGAISISGSGSFIYGSSASQTLAGIISGSGSLLQQLGSLTLTATNTYTGNTTIGGGTLALGGAGKLGNGSYAGAIANSGLFIFNSSASQTLSGAISGTGSLFKNGAGTLTLSGSNSYTGNTTINSGTLIANGGGNGYNVLGTKSSSATITVNNGGTLLAGNNNWLGTTGATDTNLQNLVINAGGTVFNGVSTINGYSASLGAVSLNGGTLVVGDGWSTSPAYFLNGDITVGGASASRITFTGTNAGAYLDLTANRTFTVNLTGSLGADLQVDAPIVGSGTCALIKTGSGTMLLNGTNTYSGATTITQGTLSLGGAGLLKSGSYSGVISNAGSFIYNSTGIQTLAGAISGTGSLTQQSGVLTLAASNTYTGATAVVGGTLKIGNASALNANNAVTVGGNGSAPTFDLNNNSVTIAGLNDGGYTTGTVTNSGTSVKTLTLGGNGNYSYAGAITATTPANFSLIKTGAGTQTLTGSNLYSGSTSVTGGVLNIQNGTALGAGSASVSSVGALQLQGGIMVANGLTLSGTGVSSDGALRSISGSNTYSGLINVTSASRINSDADTLYLTTGGITLGNNTLSIGGAGNTVVSGILSGSGGLSKDGAGTLTLTNSNSFTGSTVLSGGTLSIGDGTAGHDGSIASSSGINLANASVSLVYNLFGTQTFSGVVSGSGSLTQQAGSLTLTATNTFTGNTTIGGGTLALGGAGKLGNGTYSGAIANSGLLAYNSSASQTLSGAISGTGSLVMNGSGVLTLTGPNSYSGNTTINSGTLQANNSLALGAKSSSSTITVNNGGTLVGNVSNWLGVTGGGSDAESLVINAGGTVQTGTSGYATWLRAVTLNGGTLAVGNGYSGLASYTLAGDITVGGTSASLISLTGTYCAYLSLSADRTFTVNSTGSLGADLQVDAPIGGSGTCALIKTGLGTMQLNGTSTYSGTTTIAQGTLTIGGAGLLNAGSYGGAISNAASFIYNSTASQTLSGAISGTGSLVMNGAGLLTLAGASSYTGNLTINSGTLQANNSWALGAKSSSSTITVNNGGTLVGNINNWLGVTGGGGDTQSLVINAGGTVQTGTSPNGYTTWLRAVTLNGGTLAVGNGYSALPCYVLAGDITVGGTSASLISLTGSNWAYLALSADRTFTVNSTGSLGADLQVDAPIGAVSGSAYTLIKTGLGTMQLNGTSFYTGATTIAQGTLTIGGSGLLGAGSYAGAISNAASFIYNSTASQTLSGAISGTGSLTQQSGVLKLGGSNSYTGATLVVGGTLQMVNVSALNSNNIVTLGGNGSAPTLDLNNTSVTIAGLNDGGYTTGTVTNSGGTVKTLTLGGTGSYIYAGAIAATAPANFSLTKTGAGTQTLTGSNSYSGLTSVTGGVLSLLNGAALGTGTASVSSVGALQIQGGITVANSLNLSGSGVSNDGALRSVSGSNTYSGLINVASPSRINSDAGALYLTSGSITLGNNTLTLGGSGNTVVSSILSGSGGLTKDGVGTVTLTNSNTFTGSISLSSGTLSVGDGTPGHDGSIASSSGINLVNPLSSLVYNLLGTQTLASAIFGNGSLIQNGPGMLTLSGSNSYTGNTTINSGTLVASKDSSTSVGFNALGTKSSSATVTVNNGGTLVGNANNWLGQTNGTDTNLQNLVINAGGMVYSSAITGTSGYSTSLGAVTLNGGTLAAGNGNGSAPAFYLNGDITVGGSSASYITRTGTNALAYLNMTANRIFAVNSTGSVGADLQVDAPIGGAYSLTKNGEGTLLLNGVNTYSGATAINQGTLTIGASGLLNAGSYAGAISNSGSFIFNSTGSQTLSGAISGTGSLVKNGAGVLTLTGPNSYTGNLTINSGTLQANNSLALGAKSSSSTITVNNGGTLVGNVNNWLGVTGGGSDVQSLVINAGGTVQNGTSGYATWLRAVTLNGGTLAVGNGYSALPAYVLAGDITVGGTSASLISLTGSNWAYLSLSADRTFTVNSTGSLGADLQVDAPIGAVGGNAYALVKTGAGTMQLNGTSFYTGATTIAQGTLTIGGAGLLHSGSYAGAISNSGSFIYNSAGGQKLSGVISGTGSLTQQSGSLTLTGSNTYTGATTIVSCSLFIDGNQSSATGAVAVMSGATLGGTGTTGGSVTVNSGGLLAPGDGGFARLRMASLTLNAGSALGLKIGGTTAGTFDTLASTAGISLGGNLHFNFSSLLSNGASVSLFPSTGAVTGNFAGVDASNSYAGAFSNVGNVWTLDSGSQELTFNASTGILTAAAIPEPGTWMLMAFGLAVIGLRRRRQSI